MGTYSASAAPIAGRSHIQRHLVLAYRPGWQSIEDLNRVAAYAAELDPTIRTFVVPTTHRNQVTRRAMAERATFVFSPGEMPTFRPLRGRVYQGRLVPKFEEVRALAAARLPVPRTAVLTPDLKLDPADWGDFVIVKPTDLGTSSKGHGFMLMRTNRVRYIPPREYPAGHPGRYGPMLVQQYVSDDGYVGVIRVLTLFGEPLYALKNRSVERIVDPKAPDAVIEALPVAHQLLTETTRVRSFTSAPDELALARAAHAAMPEIPLKGVDLLRDGNGKLYIIELNCRGNTWHFSSAFEAVNRARNGEAFERQRLSQFDALRTAARVLVARTNAEAV